MHSGQESCHMRGGRMTVRITNDKNPELAARMVPITYCWLIVAMCLIIPGVVSLAIGAAWEENNSFYRGVTLLGVSLVGGIASLLVCLCLIKPSCCYPKRKVVGTSVRSRFVRWDEHGVPTVCQPSNTTIVMCGSQPASSANGYGTQYGQPMSAPQYGGGSAPPQYGGGSAPPQYGGGSAPPPEYEQSGKYPAPDNSNTMYPPTPST